MTKSKILLAIFMGCFSLFLLSSCNKDDAKFNSILDGSSLELRSSSLGNVIHDSSLELCSGLPGNYSVENGRVKFPKIKDYQQTVNYLQNASDAQLASFRASIGIETVATEFTAFANSLNDENLTNSMVEAIEKQYSSKVKISLNNEGDKEVNLKFGINPEFTNLNGEYQVGATIVKQVGTKLISITKPSLVAPATVSETTTTNAETGVYVTETIMEHMLMCCPLSDSRTLEYNDGKRKRVRASYQLLNVSQSFIDPLDERKVLVFPELLVEAIGEHNRRHCFIFCWWSGNKTSMKHDWNINISHNLIGPANPIVINRTQSHPNTDNIIFRDRFLGNPISILTSLPVSASISVCVNSVNQIVTANNRTVTITCN